MNLKTLKDLGFDDSGKGDFIIEHKELRQKNFALKNRKSIAFFGGVAKVGGKVGKYAYKKAIAPRKPIPKKKARNVHSFSTKDLF